ncbi:hypothetical protein ABZ649_04745 [Streptomyces albidoflavus]|uniref:hypothetical protein n=1 Tax=Streptomyces albidoflavus TaxID=1886 RepID=UPI0033EA1BE9
MSAVPLVIALAAEYAEAPEEVGLRLAAIAEADQAAKAGPVESPFTEDAKGERDALAEALVDDLGGEETPLYGGGLATRYRLTAVVREATRIAAFVDRALRADEGGAPGATAP